MLSELSSGGPLAGITVAAAAPDPTQIAVDDPRPGPPRSLDDAALARVSAVSGVKSVSAILSLRMLVVLPDTLRLADGTSVKVPAQRGRGRLFETVVGADLRDPTSLPITVLAGRLPLPGALDEVDLTLAHLSRLGLKKADAARLVGTEIEMGSGRVYGSGSSAQFRARWTRAKVVGVVAQQAADGEILAPLAAAQANRDWIMSGTDGGQRFGLSPSPYTGLFVVARGLNRVADVRARITDIGYSTSAPENLIATVEHYLHVVEIVLAGIGVIALVVASLGITNALLASVRERRREIGVLKAVGGRDGDILRVFLFEAGIEGLTGGVLGTLLGVGIALSVSAVVNSYLTSQQLAGVHLSVPTSILGGGVFGATALAVVAGAGPAWRAARLPAREAVDA